jgi:hypothetical protein
MGKKHSKNAETRGWYSAAEKKRDTAQSSWGTQAMRLSADSVVDWDCCCLSTARPADPVITPEGFLYNRESLLEYMLASRQAAARKLKEWEDQMDAITKRGHADAEQEQLKMVQVCCFSKSDISHTSFFAPFKKYTPSVSMPLCNSVRSRIFKTKKLVCLLR